MQSLFGCFLVLLLGVFLIAASFIGSIINAFLTLLGFKKPLSRNNFSDTFSHGGQNEQQSQRSSQQQSHTGQQARKIFEKNESEYVDFEEIK